MIIEKNKLKKVVCCLMVIGVFLVRSITVIGAEQAPRLDKKIDREKKELDQIKKKIKGKQKKKRAAKRQEKSILSRLQEIDQRYRLHQRKTDLLELKIKEKDTQIGSLTQKRDRLEQDVQKMRKAISKRLNTIYQQRQNGPLKVLFASEDYPDFLRRLYYLKTIAKKEGKLLSRFKEKQAQLDENNRKLSQTKEHLIQDKEALGHQITHIRAERKKKSRLLSRVQTERASYERAIAELNQSSHELQGMIEALKLKQKNLKNRSSRKFSRKKGQLNWPNDGRVVSRFGRQKHPRFDTMIYRKGIEIEASKGEKVRAIFDGVVIYADWFRGYGMVIIVDHGENYYSIYAHLSKLLVSVGAQVRKDKTIGEIGGTGFSRGSKLYLEIRHQGKPMNPMGWLRKRG